MIGSGFEIVPEIPYCETQREATIFQEVSERNVFVSRNYFNVKLKLSA